MIPLSLDCLERSCDLLKSISVFGGGCIVFQPMVYLLEVVGKSVLGSIRITDAGGDEGLVLDEGVSNRDRCHDPPAHGCGASR